MIKRIGFHWPLLACVLVGLLPRALLLFEQSGGPAFGVEPPGLDAALYDRLARDVAKGDLSAVASGEATSPGYVLLLGGLYALTSPGPWPGRIANLVFGLGTIGSLYLIAWELWRRRSMAAAAGLLGAVYGPLVLLDTSGLKVSPGLMVSGLGIWLLLRALRTGYLRDWVGAGAALGVAVQWITQTLPAVLLLVLWVLLRPQGMNSAWASSAGLRRGIPVLCLVLGGAATFLPVLISPFPGYAAAQVGIHLWIGNQPKAWGGYTKVYGVRANPAGHVYDARRLAERRVGRDLSPGEVDGFWRDLAVAQVRKSPGDWWRLAVRKLGLAINAAELPNNLYFPSERDRWKAIRWLPTSAVLFPLGIAGLGLSLIRRRGPRVGVLWAWAAGILVSLVLGFVTWRYRMPLVLALVPAAAWFLVALLDDLRARARGTALVMGSVLGLCAAVTWFPLVEPARLAAMEKSAGQRTELLGCISGVRRRLSESDGMPTPRRADLLRALAVLHNREWDWEGAQRLLREAAALNPQDRRIAGDLLRVEQRMGLRPMQRRPPGPGWQGATHRRQGERRDRP